MTEKIQINFIRFHSDGRKKRRETFQIRRHTFGLFLDRPSSPHVTFGDILPSIPLPHNILYSQRNDDNEKVNYKFGK